MSLTEVNIRPAVKGDLNALVELEETCFTYDKLSRRAFNYWLKNAHCIFLVAEKSDVLLGYVLTILNRGTRLARLYSIAISPKARGNRLAEKLITQSQERAKAEGRLYMRLEVATTNTAAIALYTKLGYKIFGVYEDYYEDHGDAVRMQKCIRTHEDITNHATQYTTPWYEQITEFTCGPASLLMAMASLDSKIVPSPQLELNIWRQATTIFMTSGHGGCHPIGLALAAKQYGFDAQVMVNTKLPLFLDGVRNPDKKRIIEMVDTQFRLEAKKQHVKVTHKDLDQRHIVKWLKEGYAVVVLISTNRLNGKKAPHWVTVTTVDDVCIYVHDPDIEEGEQDALDCQHIPIAKADFSKMTSFGSRKLRTAVAIKKAEAQGVKANSVKA